MASIFESDCARTGRLIGDDDDGAGDIDGDMACRGSGGIVAAVVVEVLSQNTHAWTLKIKSHSNTLANVPGTRTCQRGSDAGPCGCRSRR